MIGRKEAEDWQRHTSDALLWTTEAATPSRGSSTQVPLLLASRWQALAGDADKRMDRRFAQALPRHSWRHHHKHHTSESPAWGGSNQPPEAARAGQQDHPAPDSLAYQGKRAPQRHLPFTLTIRTRRTPGQ